ncbi:hypothetical protein LCGC14_1472730 [marine sediment metagenome]|uniref:Uncharacterized protein n=1 Tax=marine sediment metagenome TaxID=412755 RepID=A0A0F9LSF3_9ZZZZ
MTDKEDKGTEEPEVITFKEFYERNKSIKFEELQKIVLVCKNCSHKDLLGNFIKRRKNEWDVVGRNLISDQETDPKPINPYDNDWKKPPYKPRFIGKIRNSKKSGFSMVLIEDKRYEDMFYCPKCGSSLVVLCNEFIKNNILRGLSEK